MMCDTCGMTGDELVSRAQGWSFPGSLYWYLLPNKTKLKYNYTKYNSVPSFGTYEGVRSKVNYLIYFAK